MDSFVEINLIGELERETLERELSRVEELLGTQPSYRSLLVHCTEMSGYTGEARALFVDWNRAQRTRIDAVAVVTTRKTWHMVVSTMAMLSKQRLRAFDTAKEAEPWLAEVAGTTET